MKMKRKMRRRRRRKKKKKKKKKKKMMMMMMKGEGMVDVNYLDDPHRYLLHLLLLPLSDMLLLRVHEHMR